MPAKRTIAKERQIQISAEAIQAFRDDDEDRLYDALQMRPHEVNPLEADHDAPPWPQWLSPDNALQQECYRKARAIRKALEQAVAEQDREEERAP